jgi:hypothetical protein
MALGVTSACAPANPAVAPAIVYATKAVPIAPLPADAAATASAPAKPAPTPITTVVPSPLAAPACALGPEKRGRLRGSLAFVVNGKRFATLIGDVTLDTLQLDDQASGGRQGYAVVSNDQVTFTAAIDPTTVRVAPATSTPIDGWLELHSVEPRDFRDGTARLHYRLPSRFTTLERPVVRRPCKELRLLGPPPAVEGIDRLQPGPNVPLSPRPGAAIVGHLIPPRPPSPAPAAMAAVTLSGMTVLEARARWTRVRQAGDQASVVGWVPSRAIDPDRFAGILGMLSGMGSSGPTKLRCSAAVDLVVRDGNVEHRVGRLQAGAAVPASADGALKLHGSPLSALFGDEDTTYPLKLRVAGDQFARCQLETR